jgi:hypothetical protein
MTDPLFGVFAFIVAYFISRLISERALKRLTAEEKARLLDAFSGYRIFNMVIVLSLLFLVIAGDRFLPQLRATLWPAFMVLLALVLLTMSSLSYRKLKSVNMPPVYIKSFLISTGIQYLGILCLFTPVIIKYFP